MLGVSSSIWYIKFVSKKWMQVFLLHLSPFSERVERRWGPESRWRIPLAARISFRPLMFASFKFLSIYSKPSVDISKKSSESSIERISYISLPVNLQFHKTSKRKDAIYIICTDTYGYTAAQLIKQTSCATRFEVDDWLMVD